MPEDDPTYRSLARWLYLALMLAGILFYVGWGLFFGSWDIFNPENAGVYAVTVVLVGFGLIGTLLYSREED